MLKNTLHQPLPANQLYPTCDPAQFDFKTTAGLEPPDEFIGQERAVESVRFAIGMEREGYNLFAFGPQDTGKSSLVRKFLGIKSTQQQVPNDRVTSTIFINRTSRTRSGCRPGSAGHWPRIWSS